MYVIIELWFLIVWIPFVNSVVSAGFLFMVKVVALPPLCLRKLGAGYVAMCVSWVEHWTMYIRG